MPIYEYKCQTCEKVLTEMRKIATRGEDGQCECGGVAPKIFSTSFNAKVFVPYIHNNLAPEPVFIQNSKQERHEFESRGLVDAR